MGVGSAAVRVPRILLIAGLCLVAGCGDGTETSATDGPTTTARAATTAASPQASRCADFPRAAAEALISNSDTGARKIQGEITKAAAVKSSEKVRDSDLWFISINVAGTVVTLAHNSPSGAGPEGSGLYASVESKSEQATGFPPNANMKSNLSTDGAQESRACVA